MVVAEFDGGELLSTEVIPAYNDQLTTQIFAGHDADEVAEDTLNQVLEQLAGDKIIAARARELGLTELTADDLTQIDAQAAENYETQLSDYIAFVSDGEADRDAAAKQLAEESGVTLESITQELMDEFGCDAALRDEPLRSEGYYISDASYVNSVEYVEGSMMLEQPGQVSAPLRSAQGVHLVEYIGDVTPGEVPLEEVRDAVAADALATKQAEYYDQQRQQLLEEAHVKYYPERLH